MSLLLPPASPGWAKGPKSGIIVISAGAFIASARAGLNAYSDPNAPGSRRGCGQVQDSQSAAGPDTALDTIVVPLDTVGAVTGTPYKVHVGYRVIDGGSARVHLGLVGGAGQVYETDYPTGGQWLYVSSGAYGLAEPDGHTVPGGSGVGFGTTQPVLKTGSGQSMTLRVFLESGSGSGIIDTIFLFPMTAGFPTSPWVAAYGILPGGPYGLTSAIDGWLSPGYGGLSSPFGWNGLFPTASYADEPNVGDSNGVTTPPDPASAGTPFYDVSAYGFPVSPQTIWMSARCTDKTKGDGSARFVYYNGTSWVVPSSNVYTIPADENVYIVALDQDPAPSASDAVHGAGVQTWGPAGQHVYSDLFYVGASDTGPRMNFRFRAAV